MSNTGIREQMKVHPELLAQGAQTGKDIVCLSPGIWTAVGYAALNAHMFEGFAAATIGDTSESTWAARNTYPWEVRRLSREAGERP